MYLLDLHQMKLPLDMDIVSLPPRLFIFLVWRGYIERPRKTSILPDDLSRFEFHYTRSGILSATV